MLFIFALLISEISSTNHALSSKEKGYCIYLNGNDAKISKTENDQFQLSTSETFIDGTAYLSIKVDFNFDYVRVLNVATNSLNTANFNIRIENIKGKTFSINFLDWNSKNTVNLIFDSDVPLLFTNTPSNVNIKIVKNNQLYGRIQQGMQVNSAFNSRRAILLEDPESNSTEDSNLTNGTTPEPDPPTPNATESLSPSRSVSPSRSPSSTKSPSPSRSPTTSSTPSPDPVPTLTVNVIGSTASEITLTAGGFKDGASSADEKAPDSTSDINKVELAGKDVTITQNAESQSDHTFYFAATKDQSTITIDESVSSNVGVSTENNPTVKIANSQAPVSFLNDAADGAITIDLAQSTESGGNTGEGDTPAETPDIKHLELNEVNNQRGDFSIIVPSDVDSVTFKRIQMSRTSSFSVTRNVPDQNPEEPGTNPGGSGTETNAKILEEESVNVEVNQLINISSKSDATLNNVHLLDHLYLYDDSTVTFSKNSKLNESSYVTVVIQQPKTYSSKKQPIILFEGQLKTLPRNITLLSKSDELIDVASLPLIGSKGQFSSCDKVVDRIYLDQGKQAEKIDAKCKTVNGANVLYFTTKEKDPNAKKDKKLSSGAIAAIVIAAIVVVAVIVAIIVIVTYRKKHDIYSNGGPVDADDLT